MSDRGPQLQEFMSAFVSEAEELVGVANTQLLAAEESVRRSEGNPRAVREAFRAVHTIKGLAAMVGVEPVVAVAHRMETALRAADQSGRPPTLEVLDTLLQGLQAIRVRVQALGEGKPAAPVAAALLEALEGDDGAAAPVALAAALGGALDFADPILAKLGAAERAQLDQGLSQGRRVIRLDFAPTPERAAANVNITSVREAVGKLAEIVKVVPVSVPPSPQAPTGISFALILLAERSEAELAAGAGFSPAEPTLLAVRAPEALSPLSEPDEAPTQLRNVVRVEVQRLDEAMERLSALIVTRFRLARAVAQLKASGSDTRELEAIVRENARQLRDLRASIVRTRMVRMSELLERVPLIVRGLRRQTGKKVRVEMDAGEAELDKTVAERLFPALVHLVRNAVDHAIELPPARLAAGKPEEGLLRITCHARSNTQLELAITDDGRGVDAVRVAGRARAPVPQTNAELLDLLCRPGLSTAEQATTTSGRGMGMDIVRKLTVDQLGGELELQTRPGQGTTFTLRVPLTISIVDAFSLECAAQRYVVPVASVEEILEVDAARLVHGPSAQGRQGSQLAMIERRGEAIPVVRLETAFGLPAASALAPKALVVRRNGIAVAFAVERMLGQQEVVVRPVTDALVQVVGVGGSTDLGDGRPTLVLDLPALAMRLGRRAAQEAHA